jgi:hypothetical protein
MHRGFHEANDVRAARGGATSPAAARYRTFRDMRGWLGPRNSTARCSSAIRLSLSNSRMRCRWVNCGFEGRAVNVSRRISPRPNSQGVSKRNDRSDTEGAEHLNFIKTSSENHQFSRSTIHFPFRCIDIDQYVITTAAFEGASPRPPCHLHGFRHPHAVCTVCPSEPKSVKYRG